MSPEVPGLKIGGEVSTGNGSDSTDNSYLLIQLREAFGRVVYSHKTQEKQADISHQNHKLLQCALVTGTAVSSGTFLATVFGLVGDPIISSLATSAVALLVAWVSIGTRTFKFEDAAEDHRRIASQLWDVREAYTSLIVDLMSQQVSEARVRSRRDDLQERLVGVYEAAPRTSKRAFKRAQRALKINEEMSFTTDEIDAFLPKGLRLGDQK